MVLPFFFSVNTGKTNRGLNRGLPEEIAVNYEGTHTHTAVVDNFCTAQKPRIRELKFSSATVAMQLTAIIN